MKLKLSDLIETREQKKIYSLLVELEDILNAHLAKPGIDLTDLRIPHGLVKTMVHQASFHTKAFPGVHDLDFKRIGVLEISEGCFELNYYTTWAIQQMYDNYV